MKTNIVKIILVVWTVLWVSFTVRELFRKGYYYDYKELMRRDLDGKRAYVTGDSFYQFIAFCNKKLPAGVPYSWRGVEDGSLAKRMATYYLYPHLEAEGAPFILAYNIRTAHENGQVLCARLDDTRAIFMREDGQ